VNREWIGLVALLHVVTHVSVPNLRQLKQTSALVKLEHACPHRDGGGGWGGVTHAREAASGRAFVKLCFYENKRAYIARGALYRACVNVSAACKCVFCCSSNANASCTCKVLGNIVLDAAIRKEDVNAV
jgi:hypothetical protein